MSSAKYGVGGRRLLAAGVAVSGVVASLLVSPPSGAEAPVSSAPSASTGPSTARTDPSGSFTASTTTAGPKRAVDITLITGDRVRYQVGANGLATVDVVDAVSTDFHGEETREGGLYLYPEVAQPYVASGVLDRELFNIKYLATHGYGDAQMKRLPVIVDYARSGPKVASRAENDADALAASRTERVLESIGATGLTVNKAHADRFWDSLAPQPAKAATPIDPLATTNGSLAAGELGAGVDKIWLDRKVKATLDESVPQIGAPDAWDAGYDGTGVRVAVLDTGIDETHPDMADKVVASQSFIEGQEVADGNGHGTHVASTIAGSGAASDGQYEGAAPGADLVIGKVLDDRGSGEVTQIIDGMEWAAQEQDADIVSMSIGTTAASDGTDLMSRTVNQLTASTGALFVISAGNSGPASGTVVSPGAAARALTVGAVDKQDQLASFSSTGPVVTTYDLKPEITAPGVHITAARATGTSLCQTGCLQPEDGPVDDHHTSASGTSMAAPHVSGAAAIVKQQHPGWGPDQIKAALTGTAVDSGLGLTAWQQGAGRVDVARAVSQQLRTDTASISPGLLEDDELAHTVPVTYYNDSGADLIVSVHAELRGPNGEPAPAEMISLDRDTITVPAGGSATLSVTLDQHAGEVGNYEGVIVAATDGGDSVRIPVGFRVSPPMAKLTTRLVLPTDRSNLFSFTPALPISWSVLLVDDMDQPWFNGELAWSSTDDPNVLEATLLVPDDGTYFIKGGAQWRQWSGRNMVRSATIIEPEVTVDGETVVTIDLRDLVAVSVAADQPTEKVWRARKVERTIQSGWSYWAFMLNGEPKSVQHYVYPTDPVRIGDLSVREGFMLAQPEIRLRVRSGGKPVTLQPAYLDNEGSVKRYPKFTEDTEAVLATEADIEAGRDVRGALVHFNLPHNRFDPASWERCPHIPERSLPCAVVNRARLAASAGAAGVLVTTPTNFLGGLTWLDLDRYTSQLPVPVAWLDNPQAATLAELLQTRRRVDVQIDATIDPTYEYKLWFRESGQVPADMSYQVDSKDLKRIDVGYHGGAASPRYRNAREAMHALWPGENISYALERDFDAPTRRTEYYRPTGDDVIHVLGASVWKDFDALIEATGRDYRTLVGTETEKLDWGTVATPGQRRMNDIPDNLRFGTCSVCRQGDFLWVIPQPTTGNGGQSWRGSHTVDQRLFRADGTEVPADPAGLPRFELPTESGRYRLEHVQTDQAPDTLYGREVRTTWNFTATAKEPVENEVELPYGKPNRSNPAPAAWQPVIFLNYDIPTDVYDTARAGRPISFTVYAAAGKPGSGADVEGLELEASFDDGETWTDARVVRPLGDGKFRVMVKHPRLSETTGAVTLRARAWDNAGNEVRQTIDRAYGLR